MQTGFKAIYGERSPLVTNLILIAGVLGFLYVTLFYGVVAGALFCVLPFVLFFTIFVIDKPKIYALVIYIATYFFTILYVSLLLCHAGFNRIGKFLALQTA